MSQEQYDIFGLMPPEEAQAFEVKPKVIIGTTISDVQHAREKKGLPGEYKDGWEEATGSEKESAHVTKPTGTSNYSSRSKANVEKTAEYLSYKKIVCYAREQFLIEDPSLTKEQIRKIMLQVHKFPEFSAKGNLDWIYTPPVIPKKKGKKAEVKDDQQLLGFEENGENADPKDIEIDGSEKTIEMKKDEGEKLELLPSVIDGVEMYGILIPVFKPPNKGAFIRVTDTIQTFTKWTDLLNAKSAVRYLMEGRDGLYEVRKTPVGIFKVRISNEENENAEQVSEGVDLLLPKIPTDLFLAIRDFFVHFALLNEPLEALAQIYHDGQRYSAYVPHQVVTWDSVQGLGYPEDLECADNNTLVMELHSHNVMPAVFSGRDDRDELATGLYCIWGNLDRLAENKASIAFRYSCGGRYRNLNIMDYIKNDPSVPRHLPDKHEMDQWMSKVYVEGGEPVV